MARRVLVLTSCVALSLSLPPVAQEPQHHHGEELGQVSFPVACTGEAPARMNRAVAMLHSYWFPEALRTFESVAEADPNCGIAYWGVALAHFGNPMGGGSGAPGQAAGWAAAQKGAAIGAKSDRDRAYLEAAVALFRNHETVSNRTRMDGYREALAAIVAR